MLEPFKRLSSLVTALRAVHRVATDLLGQEGINGRLPCPAQ